MPRALWTAAILVGAQALAQPSGPPKATEDDVGYRAATGLLHRDLPEQAAAEYRAFLRDHPRHPQAANARYGLAVCLARLGQWKDAAAELDAVASAAEFEFAPDALLLRAQCAVSLSDREAAVAASRALLDRFPKFEHADAAAALLGESLYGAERPEEARAVLERLAKEWPQSAARPRGEYILALIEARAGQDGQAAARLESLRSAWPQSELIPLATLTEAQYLHRASLADPAKVDRGQADRALKLYEAARKSGQEQVVPEAMLGAGQLTRAIGKPVDAGRMLDALLERFAKLPIADAARLERARAHLDENHADKALAILADMSPDGTLAPDREYWSAKCEVRLDRFEPAAQRLTQAIERSPKSVIVPDMLYDRAWAMARAGHSAEAQAAFAQFREKFPDHPLVPDALAAEVSLALSRGDNDSAAALAARFLKAYPLHARAGAVQAALGDAQLAAGHADLAAESYASFLRDHPDDPGSRSAALRNGLALARLGKTEEAARVLSGAIDAKGEADPALLRAAGAVLADAAIAAGDWPGAEARLRTLTQSPEGRTPSALLKLGLAVEHSGRTEEALSLFEEVARGEGDAGVQAAFERGQILAGQGKADEAKAAFELVIAREEKAQSKRFTVHALRHLASLASQQGRSEDAAELLGRVAQSPDAGSAGPEALYDQGVALLSAGKFEEAESVLDRFIRQAPDHARAPDARAQLAIAASRRGEYERALPMMDAAETGGGRITPAVRTSMQYERAWALNALHRADESRRAYAALLADPLPASLEAHAALDLAQLLIAADDHTGAIALLARAGIAARAADDGVGERALYLRGLCELKSDHAAEAAATLDEFLRAHPKSELAGAAALLAGQAELRNHRPELAIERLSRVVGASPPPEQLGPALLCLGEALGAAQQWDKSLAAFERYLKEFADSELWFQARFGAAWALENEGRQAEAIGAYRDVVARHKGPTAAPAQFQIGECLFAQKRHDDAVRELLKVDILYDYPEWSAAALYEAGRCLTQLDKPDEARRQFQQVTERFKDTEWASLAARQLKDTAAAPLPGSAAGAH